MTDNEFSIERVLIYLIISITIIVLSFLILISDQMLFLFMIFAYLVYILLYFILRIFRDAGMGLYGGPKLYKMHKTEESYIFNNVIIPIYEPPSDIHPAIAGFLIDKEIGKREFFATIFNAIVSGFIAIDERYENNNYKYYFLKNLPIKSTWVCDRMICDHIFNGQTKNYDSIGMADMYIKPEIMKKYIIDQLIGLKYFENPYYVSKEYLELKNNPDTFEKKWLESIDKAKFWSLAFSFGTEKEIREKDTEKTKSEIKAFIAKIKNRPLQDPNDRLIYDDLFYTELGAKERAKWLGFKDYLQTAERFRLYEEKIETFSKYLPYAVALGVETEWTNRFENMDVDRVDWFRSQENESIRRHDDHPVKLKHLIRFMGRIYTKQ